MKTDDIKSLLAKFYSGETTEEEEKRLKDIMTGHQLPRELHEEQAFFSSLCHEDSVPQGMEERLSRQIDRWNAVEKGSMRRTRRVSMKWISGMAACFLVMFAGAMMYQTKENKEEFARQQAEYEKMREAYAETHNSLMKFSEYLNKGLEVMKKQ